MRGGDGRTSAVNLETLLRLSSPPGSPLANTKSPAKFVVCKFTVDQADKYNALKTAFDVMTLFQQRYLERNQHMLLMNLANDKSLTEEIANEAKRLGIKLVKDWEAQALRPVLHDLAGHLISYW